MDPAPFWCERRGFFFFFIRWNVSASKCFETQVYCWFLNLRRRKMGGWCRYSWCKSRSLSSETFLQRAECKIICQNGDNIMWRSVTFTKLIKCITYYNIFLLVKTQTVAKNYPQSNSCESIQIPSVSWKIQWQTKVSQKDLSTHVLKKSNRAKS